MFRPMSKCRRKDDLKHLLPANSKVSRSCSDILYTAAVSCQVPIFADYSVYQCPGTRDQNVSIVEGSLGLASRRCAIPTRRRWKAMACTAPCQVLHPVHPCAAAPASSSYSYVPLWQATGGFFQVRYTAECFTSRLRTAIASITPDGCS